MWRYRREKEARSRKKQMRGWGDARVFILKCGERSRPFFSLFCLCLLFVFCAFIYWIEDLPELKVFIYFLRVGQRRKNTNINRKIREDYEILEFSAIQVNVRWSIELKEISLFYSVLMVVLVLGRLQKAKKQWETNTLAKREGKETKKES